MVGKEAVISGTKVARAKWEEVGKEWDKADMGTEKIGQNVEF